MRDRFFETAFTPSVQAEQKHHGSHTGYARFLGTGGGPSRTASLSPGETEFLQMRDSFYLATVSETGWPHVQHRGGPTGFVRALDQRTLGWADFGGNRQYVSIGNARCHDRVAMILVDYPARRRLKILGRMSIYEAEERPDLLQQLVAPAYDGRVEHFVRVVVEAFDWNCPQHITPRFTLPEIEAGLATGR